MSWQQRSVIVNLTKEAVRGSPPWDASVPIDRAYEERLYDHYDHYGRLSESCERDSVHALSAEWRAS